jgi:hypothetical protein
MGNEKTIDTCCDLVQDDQVEYAVDSLGEIAKILSLAENADSVTDMRGLIAVAMFKSSEARSRIKKMSEMRFQ